MIEFDKFLKVLLLGICLPVLSIPSYPQEVEKQVWMDYNLTIPVTSTNKFTYGGDIGLRGSFSEESWKQVVIRPTVIYRFNQIINVGGGVGGFLSDTDVHEFRMQEEIGIRWPDLYILTFFYRIRYDQQFFYLKDDTNTRSGRLRYLLGIESKDFRTFGTKRPFYFTIYGEGFKTVGRYTVEDVFVNRARLSVNFNHRLTNQIRYEIGFINQKSRQSVDEKLKTTQNIFRVRIFHRLSLKEEGS